MRTVYGVAIRKGGQGKSTTVATTARLCAQYGARVLVVDLAQPGTTTALLRNLWPEAENGALSSALMAFARVPAGTAPALAQARAALADAGLPVPLAALPSWSGGCLAAIPWDELQADAAAHLHSERVLRGLLAALDDHFDLALIDFPAEGGPLLATAIAATQAMLVPLTPETPALEGLEGQLRLHALAREAGHDIRLAGILLTRCEPKNKRASEIVQTILQSGEVEGEPIGRKLLPFAIRANEFYEQAYRYGEAVWERTQNFSHYAGYVLLAEWL
ncbi:MAG TPA: ParA family protein, partial [Ktedonobacterales bacterium]|nr:ParA family protein [Ktedonobacterales bacterium]